MPQHCAGASPSVMLGSRPEMKFDGQLEGREVSRRPARTDVIYDVWVSCDSGDFEAQIVNLSAMGFRLRCEAEVRVGWNVCLTVAKLPPVEAVICWVRGDECGGAFLDAAAL
jgi:hypothetical protein